MIFFHLYLASSQTVTLLTLMAAAALLLVVVLLLDVALLFDVDLDLLPFLLWFATSFARS